MSKAHYEHTKKRRISENFTLYEAINSDRYPQSVVMPSADVVYHLAAFAGAVPQKMTNSAFSRSGLACGICRMSPNAAPEPAR